MVIWYETTEYVPAGQLAGLAQEPVGRVKLSDAPRYCIATQWARLTPWA